MTARCVNDAEIAKAQRDFLLKKAQYDQEVKTRQATSDMAYHLQVGFFLKMSTVCMPYNYCSLAQIKTCHLLLHPTNSYDVAS